MLLAMVVGVIPGTMLLRFCLPWLIKTLLGVVVFLGENLFRLCVYLLSGIITREVLLFGAVSLPAVGGMALSALLGPRLDERKLKAGAIVLFILGGVSTIVKSLLFHT